MEKEIEPFYQAQAKQIIDGMFNSKVFNEKLTRDDMQGFEDLLAFYFQSHTNITRKAAKFTQTLEHLK